MRKVLALAALFVCALPTFAAKRVITHEDVWTLKRIGAPALSPDGRWAIVSVTEPDYDATKQVSDLWIVATDGSAEPRRLTFTKSSESGVNWAPDSRRIVFTAKREGDETAQAYVLDITGGEAQRITAHTGAVSSPQWSPDGKSILFESMFDPVKDRKARKYSARTYDAFPMRHWVAWLDEKRPRIFVQEARAGAKEHDLLDGTKLEALPGFAGHLGSVGADQSLSPEWTPDSKEVLFVAATNRDKAMAEPVEFHIYGVALSGGEPREIVRIPGSSVGRPNFSRDGKTLYFMTDRDATLAQPYSLARLASIAWPALGTPRVLTDKWDRAPGGVVESGASLYIEAEDDGFDKVFRLDAGAAVPQVVFAPKVGAYSGLKIENGVFVALYGSSAQPGELAVLDAKTGTHRMLTHFNDAKLAELELQPVRHFWFTAKNGKRIHSVIVPPPFYDASKSYPLVVFPHGGPNSMSKDGFSTRWNDHLLTSPGYFLLMTNYTGSTGFGEKFANDIERDVLRGPALETLEAVDEAKELYPAIDLNRQCAIGASYGGYLMNWYNGTTKQFKCLVTHAGAVNNESQYGTNDGGIERELRMGAPIWENKGQWNDQSPIRYSGNWTTPNLITQGEIDFRVPVSESMTTFKILQRRGVASRLIVFPDEGHWILKGENNRYHMQQILAWLEKYLQPEKSRQ